MRDYRLGPSYHRVFSYLAHLAAQGYLQDACPTDIWLIDRLTK